MKKCIPLGLLTAVALGSAQAEFKPEPIPQDPDIQQMCTAGYGFIAGKKPKLQKEPEYKGTVRYGTFRTKNGNVPFASYAAAGKGPADTVVADWNGNSDLTDEVLMTISNTVSITFANGRTQKIVLERAPSNRQVIFLRLAEWYRGEIDLGGRKLTAIMVDADVNGLDLEGEDFLLADLNGNGKIDINSEAYQLEGYSPLRSTVLFASGAWSVELDAAAPDLKLTKYTGAMGTLAIEAAADSVFSKSRIVVTIQKKSTPYALTFAEGQQSAQIPVAKYDRAGILVTPNADGKPTAFLRCTVEGGLEIEADKTRTLVLDKPEGLTVSVRQSRNSLSVTHKIPAGKDIDVSSVLVVDKDGDMTRPPPPVVKVTDPATGEVITSGKMQYGWGGSCGYSCSIPKGYKKGAQLKIVVTWDTGQVFGELTGETIHTVE